MPLPLAIEPNETRQQENWEVPLLFQGGTPIPCTGQPSIDATSSIEEIIRPRTIKSMSKEIA